ncbi:DUF2141 domain-containing protein [Ideonella sp. 4Y11]|uniref:DUF2141 domain-containing protein n=1 Tax=Ideonella aquatica TaxID=2824119 RepID=A0A940YES5_9BURK|nr:DUF2141 domain-containing protein [Ideonella aquatica]MBQ0957969.1 DUF2141 domain-containing protein [Ideonella aquatica]
MFHRTGRTAAITTKGVIAMLAIASTTAMAGDLVVNVETLDGQAGQLVVNLFASADTFRKTPKAQVMVPASKQNAQGQLSAVFSNLPAGEYALLAFHDKDGDGKLARNLVGIPTEPYAFSGQPAKFGPPDYKDAAFALPAGGATINIKLK